MFLNSFSFVFFFMVVFGLYWSLPKKYQWVWLLIASYYFFASWKPAYLVLVLSTTLVNYWLAILINKSPLYKRRWLFLAIGLNLGILLSFKYLHAFGLTLNQMIAIGPWRIDFPQFKWLLPLGISFYTFQTISYLIDVYKKTVKPEKHLGYLALYLCFFPQLVAGPIERAKELLPQLKQPHIFRYSQAVSGLKLFVFGLFLKMVIADNLAVIVDRVFGSLNEYKGFSLVMAVVLFSWQIYADFAGYTDMARGVARMLGIDLVENFNTPYFSTSIHDFWRRWHMSLSRWFRDYIYIPLGGSRKGWARTCLNYLIVFSLCGLWHGVSWNYLLWGTYLGLLMSLELTVKKMFPSPIKLPKPIKMLYTYILICIAWVLFRSASLAQAFYIYRNALVGIINIFRPNYIIASLNQVFITNRVEMLIILGLIFVAILLEFTARSSRWRLKFSQHPTMVRFSVYVVLVLLIIHLRNAQIKEFIYVRF